jgi:hypothetical protein
MRRIVLLVALALVSATVAVNAQTKVAFVGVYDQMSDLQLDDEDVYDAAVWCVNTYGGEYLPVSQITPAKLSEYAALWIYYDNDYLAAAPWEIIDNSTILGYLTDYYKGGGNLLLGTYGNYLLKSMGRINLDPDIVNTGTGAANPDRFDLAISYGTWDVAPEFIDRSTDPIYADLVTAEVTRPNGLDYPVIPLHDGGWKEDHNYFWSMEISAGGPPNDNPEKLHLFETTFACQALGTWGHVADYFGAAVVRWLPQGDFHGKAITIGAAAYEWHNNSGVANQYLNNIKKMTDNALKELSKTDTGIDAVNINNAVIRINNGILKIDDESILSAKIYSVNGMIVGTYNNNQIEAGINVAGLSKGVYVVQLVNAQGNTYSRKVVK